LHCLLVYVRQKWNGMVQLANVVQDVYTLKVIGMDEFEDVKPARKPEQSEIQAQVAQLQKR